MSNDDQMYIGYEPNAPKKYHRTIRISLAIVGVVLVAAAILIGKYQKPFNAGLFEFGTLTEVAGVLRTTPEPRIVVTTPGVIGNRSVMLVGFGKHGALSTIEGMENKNGTLLDGMNVIMRGTLIHGEGKTWMELTEHTDALVAIGERGRDVSTYESGNFETLKGEIVDPKCYFGVMKPGNGSTHRSCAIRCVSGGIPPVLRVDRGPESPPEFYLLRGQAGERINSLVAPFIAEQIQLQGLVQKVDDWSILQVDPAAIRLVD